MNILMTGGTGFIGSALCERLLRERHTVTVLTREMRRAQQRLSRKVKAIESIDDLTGEDTPEVIVNLAGLSLGSGRWTKQLKQRLVSSRIGVTGRLIDYIAYIPKKPSVLISGSAVGYYGARGDEALDERSAAGDEFQAHLCNAWEAEALKAGRHGVRVCLLRTGVVLGRGGGALSSLLVPFRLGLGGYVGSGKQWMSWIHIDDLIGIILHLMASDSLRGAFNCAAPNPETNRDFGRKLAKTLHRPAIIRAPGWLVRLLVGEMAHLYLTGQKVLPEKVLQSGYKFQYPELSMALAQVLA